MEKEKKERKNHPLLLRYLISFAVAALMALGVMSIRGLFSGEEMSLYDTYKALCDGFFVAGILMLCFGCIVFVAQEGAFDALRFVGHSLIGLLKKEDRAKKAKPMRIIRKSSLKKEKASSFI